jgi:hypothetical protein
MNGMREVWKAIRWRRSRYLIRALCRCERCVLQRSLFMTAAALHRSERRFAGRGWALQRRDDVWAAMHAHFLREATRAFWHGLGPAEVIR